MIKFAFVNDSTNYPEYIITPSEDTLYTDGTSYSGYTARAIDINTVDDTFLSSQYWNAAVFATRPASPVSLNTSTITANGVSSCTFSGVQNPSTVTVITPNEVDPIAPFTVTDGVLTVTSTIPSDNYFTISHFPNLDFTATITAS